MNTMIKTAMILPAAMVVSLFGFASNAKADTWDHIDQLAVQLEQQTAELHDEAHAHFRNSPLYRTLDDTIDQMEKLAIHIHELQHTGASIPHLSKDLRTMKLLEHKADHLLVLLGRWNQVDPVAYRHLGQGIRDVKDTTNHMRRDLRELEHHGLGGHPHGVGYPQPGRPGFHFRIGFQR